MTPNKVGSIKTAKDWLTDPGENEGLELEITKFNLARCPGCFKLEEVLLGIIPVRGIINSFYLTYEMSNDGVWKKLLNRVECNPANKN